MKKIKIYLLLLLTAACSTDVSTENHMMVVFDTSIHCSDCVDTIFDNMPKESGVVDLKAELETKTVTIIFDSSETTVEKLAEKINELGYSAFVKSLDKYEKK